MYGEPIVPWPEGLSVPVNPDIPYIRRIIKQFVADNLYEYLTNPMGGGYSGDAQRIYEDFLAKEVLPGDIQMREFAARVCQDLRLTCPRTHKLQAYWFREWPREHLLNANSQR